MQHNAENGLEATALKEIGELELVVAKVGELGTADVASRGSLSGAGSRSGALRLGRSSSQPATFCLNTDFILFGAAFSLFNL